MKRSLILGLGLLSLLALLVTGTGFSKMTGGGWFTDWYSGNKITVSLNGQPLDEYVTEPGEEIEAKGQFQLIDHGTKDRIHIEFSMTKETDKPWVSFFAGLATLNGEEGYFAGVEFHNDVDYGDLGAGDLVTVVLLDGDNPDFSNPVRHYAGFLSGGIAKQKQLK